MKPIKTLVFAGVLLGALASVAHADDFGVCQKESGDVAIAACNRAINSGKYKGKSLSLLYIYRGAEWRGKKEDDKALADYSRAINLDSSIPAIYNNRANIYRDRGDLDRAIADYNTAIRLDPVYTAAYTNRGLAYERKDMFDKAREDFQAALAVPPKHNDGKWAQDTATKRLKELKVK